MQFKIFFGSSWPRGIFQIQWKNTWNLKLETNKQTTSTQVIYSSHTSFSGLTGGNARPSRNVCQHQEHIVWLNIPCAIHPSTWGQSSKRHQTSNITMKQEIYQREYAVLPSSWLIPTSWYTKIGSSHPPLPFNREVATHKNLRPLLMLPVQGWSFMVRVRHGLRATAGTTLLKFFKLYMCGLAQPPK